MNDRWHQVVEPVGKRLVPFGPAGDRLPARFKGIVERTDPPVRVTVMCSFNGTDRVKVENVTVERTDGQSVTPEDMARLKPAAVITFTVYEAAAPNWGAVFRDANALQGKPVDSDVLRALARVYWLAYVAWGNPRQEVMKQLGLPRTTANRWIRQAAALYGLPGPHSGGE